VPAPAPRPPVSAAPVGRHVEAVTLYERALQALQQHDYPRAAELLQAILDGHPEEKELHERVRLYLNVCRRQTVPPDATPRTREERVYAATLAINAGAYDDGLAQLEGLLRQHGDNDHVHYMLAVVHTLRHNLDAAVVHLQRAIDLNAENRHLAWQDADLETLRADTRFRQVAGGTPARRDRRIQPSR
jgi:outer membrane protein assembly factor BamD (BamD/ComL family)